MTLVSKALAALVIYAITALLPPRPFEKPLFMLDLLTRPAPARVDVPVAGVSARRLHDTWGAARSAGRTHQGIDIFAARGTPVIAATDGLVTRVGTNDLGGQVVWVMGPGRQMHYYAHLDRYGDKRAGDIVRSGDVLGTVGTTGNARGTPPHLHYGIYANGAINPFPLLVAPGPERTSREGRGP